MYKQKYLALEDVWDKNVRKLMICIDCATDLGVTGSASSYVKLSWGKQKYKTKLAKKTTNPTWQEVFLFPVEEDKDVTFEVYATKRLGKDTLLGQNVLLSKVKWPLKREHIYETTVSLQAAKAKGKAAVGTVTFRYYYSDIAATRPRLPIGKQDFYYDECIDQFKTGDLIAYSGIGLLDTVNKLVTNTEYSHVGLLLRLPNKWTRRDDFYVFEVSRNIDNFLDGFVESAHHGLSFFRFFERLHQFHGTKIWHVPLNQSIPDISEFMDWIWSTHLNPERFLSSASLTQAQMSLLEEFNLVKTNAQKADLIEVLSPNLVISAFEAGGLESLHEGSHVYPADLVASKRFDDPVLLRDVDLKVSAEESFPEQYYYVAGKPLSGIPSGTQRTGFSASTIRTTKAEGYASDDISDSGSGSSELSESEEGVVGDAAPQFIVSPSAPPMGADSMMGLPQGVPPGYVPVIGPGGVLQYVPQSAFPAGYPGAPPGGPPAGAPGPMFVGGVSAYPHSMPPGAAGGGAVPYAQPNNPPATDTTPEFPAIPSGGPAMGGAAAGGGGGGGGGGRGGGRGGRGRGRGRGGRGGRGGPERGGHRPVGAASMKGLGAVMMEMGGGASDE